MVKTMNREQILSVYQQGPEAVAQLVEKQLRRIEQQENTIHQLQARVKQLKAHTKTQDQQPLASFFGFVSPSNLLTEENRKASKWNKSDIDATCSKRRQPSSYRGTSGDPCQSCGVSLEHVPALRHSHPASMGSSIVADKGDSTRMRNQSCPYCHRLHQAEFPSYVTKFRAIWPKGKSAACLYLT